MSARSKLQARHKELKRVLPDDAPAVQEVARELKAERLAEHIRRLVDSAPPLTAEQRDRLALMLRTGGPDAA